MVTMKRRREYIGKEIVMMKTAAWILMVVLVIGLVAIPGCGDGDSTTGSAEAGSITVGSKEFTEQLILGQMMILLLEEEGWDVDDKTGLGGTVIARTALESGDIDVYMEYTGTGLITYLGHEDAITDSQLCYDVVKQEDLQQNGIVWLDRSLFDNTYTLMMRSAHAEVLGIDNISDLASHINAANRLKFASGAEFQGRDDGLPGVEMAYGFEFDDVTQMLDGLTYKALKDGDVDVAVGFATTGLIAAYDLVNLEDDKHFFPVYNVAPTLKKPFLDEYPEVENILNLVAPLLDTETMQALNNRVDSDKEEPSDVARDWLIEVGLIIN